MTVFSMRLKLKVVFDTNIYISAIIFGGNPRQCLELARKGEIELFTSRAILLELANKLRVKFLWSDSEIREVIEGIGQFAGLVSPKQRLDLIKDEPDNRILECALEAKADYIVSGDKKDLLSINKFKSIKIISAKQFLGLFWES